MHVKICGITNSEDALIAAQSGANFIGLILAPSVRQVTRDAARDVIRALPPGGPQPVLVFRDASAAEMADTARFTGVGWVQLHGSEPVETLIELHRLAPQIRKIKAWELGPAFPDAALWEFIAAAQAARATIDVILLDRPKSAAPADPQHMHEILAHLARSIRRRPPFVWGAGGLTPANVATFVTTGAFDGVDVAAGVERSPGLKDPAAVAAFVAAVRAAAHSAPSRREMGAA